MRHEELFSKMNRIIDEIERIDREEPTGPDGETNPRIVELLKEGEKVQRELDPLVRETFRDDPAILAEWDSVMSPRDDLDEEDIG
jgi:hypothetical protein